MPLRTVRVPSSFAPLFERAEAIVGAYFSRFRQAPERGTIEIDGERYVLVRAAGLSVEFFDLVERLFGADRRDEARVFARSILFDLAHSLGKSDARAFHSRMGLEEPVARLSAGPVHFAHTGWAFVDIFPESVSTPDENFCLYFDHPYSFEADAWLRADRRADVPICTMSSGYSSGWCAESFGLDLVASEVLCRAKGDECCRFVMAPPARIEEAVRDYVGRDEALSRSVTSWNIQDFFSRKRLEEDLRGSRDELEARVVQRTRELTESRDRLQREIAEREAMEHRLRESQKLEAVGRLAGGVAHDFNNILTVIDGYAELIAGETKGRTGLEGHVAQIHAAVERAGSLTRQLLAFSRQQVLETRTFDLSLLVTGVADMLRRLIPMSIEVRCDLPPQPVWVAVDYSQLEQVIVNLAVNARDAMVDGGRLSINLASVEVDSGTVHRDGVEPGSWACLTIKDTGSGMDESTMSRIFEPFFTTKQRGERSGLGLASVYGIIRQSGGVVGVSSRVHQGTEFRIWLRRVEEEAAAPVETVSESSGRSLRGGVLLVEDEADVRRLLVHVLSDAGYDVLEAENGIEALDVFHGNEARVNVLVTDLVMPHMNGAVLADHVAELRPGLRVLFMSGYAGDALDQEFLKRHRSQFLQKPYRIDEFKRHVEDLMNDAISSEAQA